MAGRIDRLEKESKQEQNRNQEIVLKSMSVNPFNTWDDWYSENGEAIITFITMKQHLYDQWRQQAITSNTAGNYSTVDGSPVSEDTHVRVHNHDDFENDFDGPGIYRDSTHYNDRNKADESYTIILPTAYMNEETCREWLSRLNEEFNRNFVLEKDDYKENVLDFHAEKVEEQLENESFSLARETIKKVLEKYLY